MFAILISRTIQRKIAFHKSNQSHLFHLIIRKHWNRIQPEYFFINIFQLKQQCSRVCVGVCMKMCLSIDKFDSLSKFKFKWVHSDDWKNGNFGYFYSFTSNIMINTTLFIWKTLRSSFNKTFSVLCRSLLLSLSNRYCIIFHDEHIYFSTYFFSHSKQTSTICIRSQSNGLNPLICVHCCHKYLVLDMRNWRTQTYRIRVSVLINHSWWYYDEMMYEARWNVTYLKLPNVYFFHS